MRRVIGGIVVILVVIIVAVLMTVWGLRNEVILNFTATVGSLLIGAFFASLVAWFLMPILDKEE